MFEEMQFLFDLDRFISNDIETNTTNVKQSKEYNSEKDNFEINTYTITTGDIKNYIKGDVNKAYESSGKNPYLKLLEDFSTNKSPSKGLELNPTDFAYLRDIGVQPINRLVILRRYPVGALVTKDLNDMKAKPISVIIGWVKADTLDILNFSFSEVWKRQGKDEMLHILINQIMSKEFGLGMDSIMPVPGWLAGTLFGILKSLYLISPDTKVPFGDPNVLRESITREIEDVGHTSNFTIKLETVYEQKYIGGVDMTSSTMDILQNLLTMGTSNIRFMAHPGLAGIKKIRDINNNSTNINAWITLISQIFNGLIKNISGYATSLLSKEKNNDNSGADKDSADTSSETASVENTNQTDNEKMANKISKSSTLLNELFNSTLVRDILASTVGKYVWPLRGSIAMLTGEAATPWHLTIGNPYAPLLSMNNVKVSNVDVTFTGEMQYNDIPKYIKVNIDVTQGRNLGGNEIMDSFGIVYQRKYKKVNK